MPITSEPPGGTWRVVSGDVVVALDEAEWWGASLAVLVSAVHHPGLLAAQLPDTVAGVVAEEVLADLDQLRAVAVAAKGDTQYDDGSGWRRTSVRRDGADIVFSPGAEISNLAWCLWVFARAVLAPDSEEAAIAKGATAYAASAWSRDIGVATGAFQPRSRTIGGGAT